MDTWTLPGAADHPAILAIDRAVVDVSAVVSAAFVADAGGQGGQTAARLPMAQLDAVVAKMGDGAQCAAGGLGLNTARAAAWWLALCAGFPSRVGFLGILGDDASADRWRSSLASSGVAISTLAQPGAKTTTVAALITEDGERALLWSDEGVAPTAEFAREHLPQLHKHAWLRPEAVAPEDPERVVYVPGWFVLVKGAMEAVEQLATTHTVAVNLAGVDFVRGNLELCLRLVRCATLLFGNDDEYEALVFALEDGSGDDDDEGDHDPTAGISAALELNADIMAVMTCGARPAVVGYKTTTKTKVATWQQRSGYKSTVATFIVEFPLPPDVAAAAGGDIVDTTGAGDAFVGGFLAQRLRNEAVLEDCAVAGHFCARAVCGERGTAPPVLLSADKLPESVKKLL